MNRSARRHIPSFSLYGEQPAPRHETDALHVEDIQSRSAKYLWRIGSHRHAGLCQCVYVASGPVNAELDGVHRGLEGPAAFVIPAGTVHGFAFHADTRGFVLTMNLDRLASVASAVTPAPITALFSVPRILVLAADRALAARVTGLFDGLIREFRQPERPGPQIAWLACSVLWILAGASPATAAEASLPRDERDRLRRFKSLVEIHYAKRWPVKRYARLLALSESRLNRICRMASGGSAFDIIQRRLALEARRRLVYAAGPVAVIAAQLGFKDPAYFCRFFRKHTGVSPTEFRRRPGDR